MRLFECFRRKREYMRIRGMRNAINVARRLFDELCYQVRNHPNKAVRAKAAYRCSLVHRDIVDGYRDIHEMMQDYRKKYPKTQKR